MLLDIVTPDIGDEADRLEALGARPVSVEGMREHGSSWILMEDPEGNEFLRLRRRRRRGLKSAVSAVGLSASRWAGGDLDCCLCERRDLNPHPLAGTGT